MRLGWSQGTEVVSAARKRELKRVIMVSCCSVTVFFKEDEKNIKIKIEECRGEYRGEEGEI